MKIGRGGGRGGRGGFVYCSLIECQVNIVGRRKNTLFVTVEVG